jgi:AcrR family transcriptional regulator
LSESSASTDRPVRGRPPNRAGAPRGEHAVRQSLIEAATELFVSRGPARVTVREIAAAADVNHGLVHHYFGTKDGLLRAVLDRLAHQAADEMVDGEIADARFLDGGATAQHGRIMAHLVLDARDPTSVQDDFPAVRALVDALRSRGLTADQARGRAAQVTALVLGWQLFEPFLAASAGVASDDATRTRLLDEGVTRLLA